MKKINTYLYAAVLIMIAFTSCKKDFLQREPLTNIGDGAYFNSANDLQIYVNKYYTALGPVATQYYYSGFYNQLDMGTDDVVGSSFSSAAAGNRTIPQGGGWSYGTIRDINYFMQNYKKAVGTQSEIDKYVGEAFFFRAWYYFSNLKNFGDVPIVTEVVPAQYEEASKIKRSPRNMVAKFILADLDTAIMKLPLKKDAARGRLNKEAALLFKSRIALYEGTWEKYHAGDPFGVAGSNGSDFLQEARKAAKDLIDLNNIKLYGSTIEDYKKLFYTQDLSTVSEVIFWKDYSKAQGIDQRLQYYIKLGGNSGFTKAKAESYLCLDGNPISYNGGVKNPLYKGDLVLREVASNRDPRLDADWTKPGDLIVSNPPVVYQVPAIDKTDEERDVTGYQIRKGLDPQFTMTGERSYENGSIIFRYAEALLNYAEASAELGVITQGDLDMTVNALRRRASTTDGKKLPDLTLAGLPVTDDNPEYSWGSTKLVNEIRRERRSELAFEGFRWDDLMRWAIAHRVFTNGYRPKGIHYLGSDVQAWFKANKPTFDANTVANNGKGALLDPTGYIDPYLKQIPNGFAFNPNRDYLRPLSYNEINLGGYTQNPGWQ